MKKLTIQKIDGYDIIINIGSAGGSIDAEATKAIVAKQLEKTPVWKRMEELKNQVKGYAYQAAQAKRNTKDATTPAEKRKFHDEFLLRYGQMRELEKDLLPVANELKAEWQRLMIDCAVYFQSVLAEGLTDELVTDAEAVNIEEKMQAAAGAGAYLTRQGEAVQDFRGRTFYKKNGADWHKFTPGKLGETVPAGAIEAATLSDGQRAEIAEQNERARVSALKPAERLAEKNAIVAGLISQANVMRGELEITGEAKPLEKAQKWLADEKAKVETKYA